MTCMQKFSTWNQTFLIKFFQDQMMFNSINFCTPTALKQLSHLCHIYPNDFFFHETKLIFQLRTIASIQYAKYMYILNTVLKQTTQPTSLTAVCFSNSFCHLAISLVRKNKRQCHAVCGFPMRIILWGCGFLLIKCTWCHFFFPEWACWSIALCFKHVSTCIFQLLE